MSSKINDGNHGEPPRARFQRTDQWIPVYSWLESLDTDEVVKSKEIADWLSKNPRVKDQLYSRHSRYHLMHYIQKCHLKMLRRREKLKKGAPLGSARIPAPSFSDGMMKLEIPQPSNFLSNLPKHNNISLARKNEASLRYELLTALQNQLTSLLSRQQQLNSLKESSLPPQWSADNTHRLSVAGKDGKNSNIMSGDASHAQDIESLLVAEQ